MSALVSSGLYFDDDLNLSLTTDLQLFDEDPFLLPPEEEIQEEHNISSSPDQELRHSEESQSPLSVHNYSKNGSSEDEETSPLPSHRAHHHHHQQYTSRGPMERNLTEEEKRLLAKEGYMNFPDPATDLTKQQERILRKIRRKIRNKKSAQCSRQRKKEYMEQLERKFDKCCSENASLKREIAKLRSENASLSAKVKDLLSGQTSFKTSLLVLCISAVLLLLPIFRPDSLLDSTADQLLTSSGQAGVGRHLLTTEFYQSAQNTDTNWDTTVNWTVGL